MQIVGILLALYENFGIFWFHIMPSRVFELNDNP